uniref:Inositol-3-phosphate synthase n=1 Tax=Strongyloides venezuelensis TaxID=75913 RepID=A0A0K0EY20_STRVS
MTIKINVNSPQFNVENNTATSYFKYKKNIFTEKNGVMTVTPQLYNYTFRTNLKPCKTGLMLVGFGGNNGSTLLGSVIANQNNLTWNTRSGEKKANYYGSITQATTVHLGWDGEKQIYVPFKNILPMVNPNDIIIDGWDINSANMYEAMKRAQVFEPELIEKLRPHMEHVVPKPSIYYPDFIASNQEQRANNVLPGGEQQKLEHLNKIRSDIREFKDKNNLDCVIVLWTANTERYTDVCDGLNMTSTEILKSITNNAHEISPSNIFAVASILEGAHYINGSPQNTLVPGIIQLAREHNTFVGGDDFKSGQTKFKSALVDFLVNSGLKPESIVSYNHLGNNDGKNLSEAKQFRSKEISKASVVDDMVKANKILYPDGKKPDHCIVIKYVPYVGDSKRAMDEYISSIYMGGQQTLVIHNTCEDSLLAVPLILDLAIITELCTRITYSTAGTGFQLEKFDTVLSLLSLMLKAPVVPEGSPVINAFMKQFNAVTKLLTICAGVDSDIDCQLEFFTKLNLD